MPRLCCNCSKRVMPMKMFRSTSGDHGSPMTSSVRAIEQAISPNRVRCMYPV
jgi:hypothetical protein